MSRPPIALDPGCLAGYCAKWRIRRLALFGSVLRADFGPDSDLDVLMEFEPAAPWDLLNFVAAREIEEYMSPGSEAEGE